MASNHLCIERARKFWEKPRYLGNDPDRFGKIVLSDTALQEVHIKMAKALDWSLSFSFSFRILSKSLNFTGSLFLPPQTGRFVNPGGRTSLSCRLLAGCCYECRSQQGMVQRMQRPTLPNSSKQRHKHLNWALNSEHNFFTQTEMVSWLFLAVNRENSIYQGPEEFMLSSIYSTNI